MVSISEWAENAILVSKLIECKIKSNILNKKLGLPYEEIDEDWVLEAGNKLLMPPELIMNEIRLTSKRLQKEKWVEGEL